MADLFSTLEGLEGMLDYQLQRQSVLSANLANVQTPGYREHDLLFEKTFMRAQSAAQTNGAHMKGRTQDPAHVVHTNREPSGLDDNNVRMERTMAKVAANKMRYEANLEILKRKLGLLKYAATNGGK